MPISTTALQVPTRVTAMIGRTASAQISIAVLRARDGVNPCRASAPGSQPPTTLSTVTMP